MTLHWSTDNLKKLLPDDLCARLNEAWGDPYYPIPPENAVLNHFAAHTGELLFATPVPGVMSVGRQRLIRLLREGLDVQVTHGQLSHAHDAC